MTVPVLYALFMVITGLAIRRLSLRYTMHRPRFWLTWLTFNVAMWGFSFAAGWLGGTFWPDMLPATEAAWANMEVAVGVIATAASLMICGALIYLRGLQIGWTKGHSLLLAVFCWFPLVFLLTGVWAPRKNSALLPATA